MARVIFFGSPQFGVPCLKVLARDHEVVVVVCPPDSQAGRGQALVPCAAKTAALALGLNVLESKLGHDLNEVVRRLTELNADLGVMVAFGPAVPAAVLEAPRCGFVMVHASLLPRWRGIAPIERAIEVGDSETGISLVALTANRYEGPIYAAERVAIAPTDDAVTLTGRLSVLGAEFLIRELPSILDGRVAIPQGAAGVTDARKIEKTDHHVDWKTPAQAIVNRQRALVARGGLEASLEGERIILFGAELVDIDHHAAPGARLPLPGRLVFATADGRAVSFSEVQEPDRTRLPAVTSRFAYVSSVEHSRRSRLVSAALRHMRVAEHLLVDGLGRSFDDSFYIAGFGPECAQAACLSEEWFERAIGHGFTDAQIANLRFVMSLDTRARRYLAADWAAEFPILMAWRVLRRYDRTGSVERKTACEMVASSRTLVDRVASQLWADGMLDEGAFL